MRYILSIIIFVIGEQRLKDYIEQNYSMGIAKKLDSKMLSVISPCGHGMLSRLSDIKDRAWYKRITNRVKIRPYIRNFHNEGALLSIASRHSFIITILSITSGVLLSIYLIIILLKEHGSRLVSVSRHRWNGIYKWGISLLLMGAWSNSIDRVKRGYVVDYISFGNSEDNPGNIVYNVGDFAIFLGSILMIISGYRDR